MPIDISKIRLTDFIPIEFSVRGQLTNQQSAESGVAARFHLTQDIAFFPAFAQNRIEVHLHIEATTIADQTGEPMGSGGSFGLNFGFFIDNLPELLLSDATNATAPPQPPPQLLSLLASIAYSTARGVLWTRLAGTALEGFNLPVVDINQLLTEIAQAKAGQA